MPIHWLFCEELSHSLAFCAFFPGCGAGTQISGSGHLKFLSPAPEQFGSKNQKKHCIFV